MAQQTSTQALEGVLHTIPQLIPDPSALLNRKLEISLQPARGRVFRSLWQSRTMANSIEERELIKAVSVQNALEVELQVRRARCAGSVPQQPKQESVSDDSP